MKKSLWAVLLLMFIVTAIDLLVFEYWLPFRFEENLNNDTDRGQLSFENIEFNWMDGHLVGGQWKSPELNLTLEEGLFSYSFINWFLAEESKFKHLEMRNLKVHFLDDIDTNSSVWSFLEFLRKSSLDFGCDSIDITGEILRKDTLVPFSFIATKTKHVNELKAALEINLSQAFPFLEEVFPSTKPLLIKAFIKKDISLNKDRLTVSLLFVDYGTLLLQSNGDGDFIEFVLPRKQRSLSDFKLSVSRKHGQNKFSGDWNGTLVSKDLIKRFPILSFLNAEIIGEGRIAFDENGNEFVMSGQSRFSGSSFFFPKEGILNGDFEWQTTFFEDNWILKDFKLEIQNSYGERLKGKIDSPFSGLKNLEKFHLIVQDFNLGRFKKHFTKEPRLSGRILGALKDGKLQLRGEQLTLNRNQSQPEEININSIFDVSGEFVNWTNSYFALDIFSDIQILESLLPKSFLNSDEFQINKFELQGKIKNSSWAIEGGEIEIVKKDNGAHLTLKAKDQFSLEFKNGDLNWIEDKKIGSEGILFYGTNIKKDFRFGDHEIKFIGELPGFSGKIIFENGNPVWVCSEFTMHGKLKIQDIEIFKNFEIKGELKYFPNLGTYGLYTLSNFTFFDEVSKLAHGKLSMSVDKKGVIRRLSSKELDVEFSFFKAFPFLQLDHFSSSKIKIHNFDWQFEEKNELIVDGLLIVPPPEDLPKAQNSLSVPVKWTFVENKELISHWIKMTLKKSFSSDLEINFLPESQVLSFNANQLSFSDIWYLFNSLASDHLKWQSDFPFLLQELFKFNFQVSVAEFFLNSLVTLSDFRAELNRLENKFSFKSTYQGTPLKGSMKINLGDGNLSTISSFELQISGENTPISFFENLGVLPRYCTNGFLDWSIDVNGSSVRSYEVHGDFKMNDTRWNLLINKKDGSSVQWLKDKMESSLGNSFSWSPPQSEMLEILSRRLQNIQLDQGSLNLSRDISGKWQFSLLDWQGPEVIISGRGNLSEKGILKINLLPGFRGEWADFLKAVNILAAGKSRLGYRTLKREPLVIEGSRERIKLINWWKIFGQGIGLEPSE